MWLQDGAEAAAFLAGGGAPPPRVVLLDVGLPGLDGLSVLRDMARRDALAATRVIMVTLRSSEAEVLEALEIGAFDHVAKPFSVSVLVHRVRRAIESLPP
jgi:DNA-binding response OmpR family regulator